MPLSEHLNGVFCREMSLLPCLVSSSWLSLAKVNVEQHDHLKTGQDSKLACAA